jgi:hypothetical protein
MNIESNFDIIDGKKVPQLCITEDYILYETHQGTVNISAGQFTLRGIIQGTLNLMRGASAKIEGSQQGSVNIANGATAIVTGAIQGSTTIENNGILIIEPTGRLSGSLANFGKVIIRGVFGGQRTGNGEFHLEGNGYIKMPTIRNGNSIYEW